jgi:NTE family protein
MKLGLAVLLISAAVRVSAAPPESAPSPPQRPRIGLVLSGGGALGLAHVGVIKVLEELHVPVDCVAGTSMGAIVGGLYAAGYSPEELEQLATTLPWREILLDRPDRRHLPYRRKMDDLTYLTRWEMGFSDGRLRMPPSMIAGQRLGVELRVLGLRAAGITDFDELPLPFRAVAADLDTGEVVVLGSGDLATALRASMAVPGVFAPTEVNGRVLVDGGVVANLPVETARAMGADIIIAIDVGVPLASQQRPDSIAGILSRTSSFLTRLNVEHVLPGVDILIRPELREWKLLDFHGAAKILPRGADAARKQIEALRALSVGEDAWKAYLRRQRRTAPALRLASVSADPGPGLEANTVSKKVHSQPGHELDTPTARGDLKRLWELGEFVTTDFTLVPEGDAWSLRFTGRSKPWGPNYLRFGLAVATDLEGESQFDTQAALTMTRLNRWGAELKTAVQVGQSPGAQAELYQPLTTSRIPFLATGASFSQVKTQIPIDASTEQYRFWVQRLTLDAGLALGRYGELRAGIRRDSTNGRAQGENADDLPQFDRSDGGLRLNLTIDQIDSVNFPRNGLLAFVDLFEAKTSLGADIPYERLDFNVVLAGTHRRHTLVGILHGGSALGGTLPPSERLHLGGLFSLSGLPRGEVSGSYGGVATLIYFFRLGRLPNFGEGIYVGASLEAGNLWETQDQVSRHDLLWSYAIVFGADTFLGPVYFAHGVNSGGKDSFYLLLGRTF